MGIRVVSFRKMRPFFRIRWAAFQKNPLSMVIRRIIRSFDRLMQCMKMAGKSTASQSGRQGLWNMIYRRKLKRLRPLVLIQYEQTVSEIS